MESLKGLNILHIVGTATVGHDLELLGRLRVRDGAVLLVPVVVLHTRGDPVRVHQDVAAQEGGLFEAL